MGSEWTGTIGWAIRMKDLASVMVNLASGMELLHEREVLGGHCGGWGFMSLGVFINMTNGHLGALNMLNQLEWPNCFGS